MLRSSLSRLTAALALDMHDVNRLGITKFMLVEIWFWR